MEKQNRIFTPERQYHCLLHFSKVPDDYLSGLCALTGHTAAEAREIMNAPGSKFHVNRFDSPLSLWEKLPEFSPFVVKEELRKDGNIHIAYRFPEQLFPSGIGFDGLIARNELPVGLPKNIQHVKRNGYEVASVKMDDMPVTFELHLVMASGNPESVITMFPGTYAPPFPKKEFQTEEDYLNSLSFWENHLMVF
jgi:hypothetical protein